MDCKEALERIDALNDGELSPADTAELRGHLAACASCADDLESRRELSTRLGTALRIAYRDVEPAPGEKEQTVRLLVDSSRRRMNFFARLAAILVMAASVGAVAYLFSGPSRQERVAVANTMANVEALEKTCDEKSRALIKAIADLEQQVPNNGGTQPFTQLLSLVTADAYTKLAGVAEPIPPAANPEERVGVIVNYLNSSDPRRRAGALFELRKVDAACVPFLVKARRQLNGAELQLFDVAVERLQAPESVEVPHGRASIDILQKDGTMSVHFKQFPNAVIELEVNGTDKVVAADMIDLQTRRADLCRRYRISGIDGEVRVGDSMSSAGGIVCSRGVMQLVIEGTSNTWEADLDPEAERRFKSVLAFKCDDEQAEKIAQEVVIRANAIQRPQFHAEAMVEAQALREQTLESLRRVTRRDLEAARGTAEQREVQLETRLKEIEEIKVRVDKLRVYLDAVKKLPNK